MKVSTATLSHGNPFENAPIPASPNKTHNELGRLDGAEQDRLVKLDWVATTLSIGRRSVWKLVARGELAKPVRIGRACRWFVSDIDAYLRQLRDRRNGKQGSPA